MTSLVTEPSAGRSSKQSPPPKADGVYGHQRPRLLALPEGALSSAGQEAIDLAARTGLHLDPWQQSVLHQAMGEKADGNWVAPEVCVNVPRQNGKGAIIEARVLWGMFIGGEQQILVSAHEFKTTMNTMKRIERLVRSCPDLHKRVKKYHRTVGREGIELHDGREVRYIARSRGSGRGFTAGCVIFDECMILGDDAMSALAPTSDAVDNSQLWYLGSAGIGSLSQQLGRLRRRALAALQSGVPDPVLAYLEWSIDPHVDECMQGCGEHDDVGAVESLLKANPAVGYRLQVEKSMHRRLTMGDFLYARERLGVGEYPSDVAETWQVVGEDAWRALADGTARMEDPVALAVDVTPERSHAAICAAGASVGGVSMVEVIDHRPGTGWVADRVVGLFESHEPLCLAIDEGGPAGSLVAEIRKKLVARAEELELQGWDDKVISPKPREIAQACGQFYDAVTEQRLVHLGQAPLATALAGARQRALSDAWAWARRGVGVDISPLVGVTEALWGLHEHDGEAADPLDNIW